MALFRIAPIVIRRRNTTESATGDRETAQRLVDSEETGQRVDFSMLL